MVTRPAGRPSRSILHGGLAGQHTSSSDLTLRQDDHGRPLRQGRTGMMISAAASPLSALLVRPLPCSDVVLAPLSWGRLQQTVREDRPTKAGAHPRSRPEGPLKGRAYEKEASEMHPCLTTRMWMQPRYRAMHMHDLAVRSDRMTPALAATSEKRWAGRQGQAQL